MHICRVIIPFFNFYCMGNLHIHRILNICACTKLKNMLISMISSLLQDTIQAINNIQRQFTERMHGLEGLSYDVWFK